MTSKRVRYWILAGDLAWINVVLLCTVSLHFGLAWPRSMEQLHSDIRIILIASTITWTLLYMAMGLDGSHTSSDLPGGMSTLILAVSVFISLLSAALYLAHGYVSRFAIGYLAILVFVGLIGSRRLTRWLLGSAKFRGAGRRGVILGDGRLARELAQKCDEHPELHCHVIGSFTSVTEQRLGTSALASAHKSTLDIFEFLKANCVTDLIVVLAPPMPREVLTLAARCQAAGIRISQVPQPYDLYTSRASLIEVGGVPLLTVDQLVTSVWPPSVKDIPDRVFAVPFLIFSAPLLAIVALYLRMIGRKAFQRELRCGKHGATFWMHRLSINRDSQKMNWFESILCETSLTELPQLWNVLRGEMSIVGPRPESPDRVKHYSEWNRQRLRVKPGITGYAQVQGLRDRHSSEEKTRFDLQYILRWSPVLDVALMLQTVWVIARRAGATLKRNARPSAHPYERLPTEV
jgi:lipopolysaccharide/colanic/teichoic acid biosynthesis glycosyltransferase